MTVWGERPGMSRTAREFAEEEFTFVGPHEDPYWTRPGWRWRGRRAFDRRAHRYFVGADAGSSLPFEHAARFQLEFLVREGLTPDQCLLDVGCGALRGGIHLIRFLEPGKYLGLDISAQVVARGVLCELGRDEYARSRPRFVISDRFEFERFQAAPDVAFANSLFTHLGRSAVTMCLANLRSLVGSGTCTFFATFTEVDDAPSHDGPGHYDGARGAITYRAQDLDAIAAETGWSADYMGPWGHPKNDWPGAIRRQMMMRFSV